MSMKTFLALLNKLAEGISRYQYRWNPAIMLSTWESQMQEFI